MGTQVQTGTTGFLTVSSSSGYLDVHFQQYSSTMTSLWNELPSGHENTRLHYF